MSRVNYVPFDDIQVTTDADQDVWLLSAITNKIILHGFEMTSEAIAAENIDLRLVRRSAAGTGGAAATEVPGATDDGAILGVVTQLVTAPGTIGDILQGWKWEQLGPLQMIYTPEMRPVIDAGAFIGLNIQSALAGTTGWSGWVAWEEI